MPEPQTADPRLAYVDFDLLDLDLFPPLAEWDDDDWDEAMLITRSGRIEVDEDEWLPGERFLAELFSDD